MRRLGADWVHLRTGLNKTSWDSLIENAKQIPQPNQSVDAPVRVNLLHSAKQHSLFENSRFGGSNPPPGTVFIQ